MKISKNKMELLQTGVFVVLAVACLVFAGCKKKAAPQERPPANVEVFESITQSIPVVISCFGKMISDEDVTIMPQVSGMLMDVGFEDGDVVKKGQMLYKIDDRIHKAQLEQAKAQLMADKASLELSKTTLARNEELYKDNLISKEDYDKLKNNVSSLEAAVQLDLASIDSAETYLDYCTITSPIDGLTSSSPIDPGNIVTPSSVLVNIQKVDILKVKFNVSEKYFERIKTAMDAAKLKLLFSVKDSPSIVSVAVLTFIDNKIEPGTGTILLKGTVQNQNAIFWPGQFVNIYLIVDIDKDATLVPMIAVRYGQDGPYVFVINDKNEVELRLVELGTSLADIVAINSGVKPGEKVVTSGQLMLYPNAKVKISKTMSKQDFAPDMDQQTKENFAKVLEQLGIQKDAINTFLNSGHVEQ
ncbi:MAG: efflux RND transporter periplasmic adaptor subunit [Kiritimatiellae bacterium]|jgi:multidrug efflux system membrane fusion protein|nr:efflux RND transporter periplasmic adaptor subunit [Kiritimatiellia bacterium]